MYQIIINLLERISSVCNDEKLILKKTVSCETSLGTAELCFGLANIQIRARKFEYRVKHPPITCVNFSQRPETPLGRIVGCIRRSNILITLLGKSKDNIISTSKWSKDSLIEDDCRTTPNLIVEPCKYQTLLHNFRVLSVNVWH